MKSEYNQNSPYGAAMDARRQMGDFEDDLNGAGLSAAVLAAAEADEASEAR